MRLIALLLLFASGASFAVETEIRNATNSDVMPTSSSSPVLPSQAKTAGENQEDAFVLSGSKGARSVELGEVSGDARGLLEQNIPELSSSSDPLLITPAFLRKMRAEIGEILATEGYFAPTIRFRNRSDDLLLVDVDQGGRTIISLVNIDFSGALDEAAQSGNKVAQERRQALQETWLFPAGQPFRQSVWSRAKDNLLESLRSDVYAAASIVDSQATIDAQAYTGELSVAIDSGPAFQFGPTQVTGLQQYPAWLLERYHPPKQGEVYSRQRLSDYQRALQNSPYFSTVAVSINPDPEQASNAKVEVDLVERRARDLGFGTGYSTNTGYRGEVSYRDRNILDKAWDFRSAIRLEQRRQVAFADIYLPPRDNDDLDSFGILFGRQDVSGLKLSSAAIGVKRSATHGNVEQRLGVNLTNERSQLGNDPAEFKRALVGSAGWTWRDVDDPFAPRDGQIYQVDIAGSSKSIISDQSFLRLTGKYQHWLPVGGRDSVVLRAEYGQIFSNSDDNIPEDYLFRTGGSSTVRGYAYQSLGVAHPEGITGGRSMAVASAEYVHWTSENIGWATFVDVGDAAEKWRDLRLKQGVGAGLRWRTPAGPIAVDVAYGRQVQRFRLEISIAIAF